MFKDDIEWVRSQVGRLPPNLKEKAMQAYTKVYTEAYAEKQNEGELLQIQHARTTANTRLRKYVQAVIDKIYQYDKQKLTRTHKGHKTGASKCKLISKQKNQPASSCADC